MEKYEVYSTHFWVKKTSALMAPAQAAAPMEEDEEKEEREIDTTEAAAYHPSAPFSELFDMATTVDPSHIISLIRKLLPQNNLKNGNQFHGEDKGNGDNSSPGSVAIVAEETAASVSTPSIHNSNEFEATEKFSGRSMDRTTSAEEAVWEESGCILWDLAANKTHAEFMVENLLLEVLLATLTVSQSARVTEISLGILANLGCHEGPRNRIVSMQGLIDTVVDKLFLDDPLCLCEALRLLTLGLQGSGYSTWAAALQPEHILRRVLWIAENTLNSQLLEKSLGLLLATVDGQQEVANILLPLLMKLDLTNLLVILLSCEVNQLAGERIPDRYSVLDTILRVIEALSTVDDYSRIISSNRLLLQLICDIIKLPDKIEVSSSCVTVVVLFANILSDEPNLASEISEDLAIFQGLLDIIPFVSDDLESWSALWSVLGKLLVRVQEDKMSPQSLQQYASVLVNKSDFIEEDLIYFPHEYSNDDHHSSETSGAKVLARITSLCRILSILQKWAAIRESSEDTVRNDYEDDGKTERLIQICCKYTI